MWRNTKPRTKHEEKQEAEAGDTILRSGGEKKQSRSLEKER
jgi:hypothetical protein